MSVLYIVLPLALLIAAAAVWGFIWMVKGGQLDDLDSPALRMLHDDSPTAHTPVDKDAAGDRRPDAEGDRRPDAEGSTDAP